jgi:hypothetical protein
MVMRDESPAGVGSVNDKIKVEMSGEAGRATTNET